LTGQHASPTTPRTAQKIGATAEYAPVNSRSSRPQISATLRLLNEDKDAEFIANPRIVTANNQKAEIKIIRQQPVPQLNFNEQTAQPSSAVSRTRNSAIRSTSRRSSTRMNS
jgi:type II secretory pathway component GspD/PulD (secretin)